MRTLKALTILTILLTLPGSAGLSFNASAQQSGTASTSTDEIPTVPFCELAGNPQPYFDKTVRITATLQQATEGQYLGDEACPLSQDERIGVGYAPVDKDELERRSNIIRKIRTSEYGSRAVVTVTGMLRNSSRRDFVWYRYRFDLIRIEKLAPVKVTYEGELRQGRTYSAAVRADNRGGLSLVIPLRIPLHQAARIEWMNLSEFPELLRTANSKGERRIIFTVISDEIRQATETRWNRTIKCKILSID